MTKITSILPKEYSGFSTAWDSVQQTDKTLDNLYARLQIEESKLNSNTEEPQVAFHAARLNIKSRISWNNCNIARECRGKLKPCKYCKRTNHTDGQCLYRNKKFCQICKRTNHNEQDCFYKNKRQDRHDREKGDKAEKESEQKKDEEKKKDEARFCFMAYNKRGGGSPDNSLVRDTISRFIADSGATGRMVYNPCMLTNVMFNLANILTAEKGASLASPFCVEIETENCKLTKVNYVPGLSKNLLSVAKATSNGDVSDLH